MQSNDKEEDMKKEMVIRAWKDPEYRARLSAEDRAALPESPAGSSLSELGAEVLGSIVGGCGIGGPTKGMCGATSTCKIDCC
jgi:mersacidin/lichenicidin family type 2 lantibiotic